MQKLAVAALRRRLRPVREINVTTGAELAGLAFWTERKPLRISLPPHMLRMQGGFTYGPGHPFVRALDHGEAALRDFYQRLQPRSLAEYYGLAASGRHGADLPPWELPWYLRSERTPPPGECGLDAAHGVSFYGPASDEKIALEMGRLLTLKASVARDGYAPDAHGDIEGCILREGDRAVFFVRGGKHRAAVLTHLGQDSVPVMFRASFPRLIDAQQAELWPLVSAGLLDADLARDILRAYLDGRSAPH